MKYLFFILFIAFISCKSKVSKNLKNKDLMIDTLTKKSIRLSDSSVVLLKFADKKVKVLVKDVSNKIENLEEANSTLNQQVFALKKVDKITDTIIKTVILKDTIYITEKKNFWGKTKKVVDSTKGEVSDSTQNN